MSSRSDTDQESYLKSDDAPKISTSTLEQGKTNNRNADDDSQDKVGHWQSFKDSFKPFQMEELDPNLTDEEKKRAVAARAPLSKTLKNRHIQMIAIASCIGTGLFVGSGTALKTGGPLGLVLGWSIIGSAVFCTIHSLGELCVAYPLPGTFITQCMKFIDPSWAFSVGWCYAISNFTTLPLQLVAASITIQYWNDTINSAAFVGIFYVLIVVINIFGVKGYGEAEFVFSLIKVVTIIGFFILALVLICGGGPQGGYIGAKYWHDPGCLANGFKGVCSVFVTAAFSYMGTELVGITAAETGNPRKTIPAATKQVFWRCVFFYLTTLIMVGFLVPYTEKRLMSSSSSDASSSPFVLAIANAGIKGLPSVINAVIMIAVISVANSVTYGCSRTLQGMADLKLAPNFLAYIDRSGRPLGSLIVTLIFGLISFICASPKQSEIFAWLMAIAGLAGILVWLTIGVCHIRFRAAMKKQNRSLEELAFVAQTGIFGSYYCILINCLVLISQFWIALYPVGSGKPDAQTFFQAYLTIPITLVCYFGHKIYTKNWKIFIPLDQIDLDEGRRNYDIDMLKQEIEEDKEHIKSKPLYYKIYRFLWN